MQKSMTSFVRFGVLTLLLLSLVACSRSNSTTQATGIIPPTQDLPTTIVLLPTDSQPTSNNGIDVTVAPTIGTLTPIVVEQPTLQTTPTLAPTPAGFSYPPALLQVEKPGEMSRLTSPFLVMANVYPGDQGMVNVQLFGEDGRLMSDQLIQLTQVESGWVSLATEIKFESLSAGESALLVLSTRDAFGRRIAQTGVPVLLLQIGKSELENAQFTKQPVILKLPVAGGFAKKGNLHIEGVIHLYNDNPVIVELFTQTGGIVANKALYVTRSEGVDFVPFALDVPYNVTKRTPVRLTIRQASEISSSADIFMYSQLIFLDP
jgi:hypothetical protein